MGKIQSTFVIELLTYVYEGFMLHHKLKHNSLRNIIFMCSINRTQSICNLKAFLFHLINSI